MREHEPREHRPMELTHDYIHEYEGYGGCESRCRVRLYQQAGQSPVFMLEELNDNPGTSITNMAEVLAARHCPERLEEPDPFRWIEHYPKTERERRVGMVEYSLVTFASYRPRVEHYQGKRRTRLGKPDWKYVSEEVVREILDG